MLCKICRTIFEEGTSSIEEIYPSTGDDNIARSADRIPESEFGDTPDTSRIRRNDHHSDTESLRDAIRQKCPICFPLWQEFLVREKLDLLNHPSRSISTFYKLMDGTHEEADVLSPGPVEFLLEIQVYLGDRHIDSKIYVLTPLEAIQNFYYEVDIGHHINTSQIEERTDSPSTWAHANRWIEECVQSHKKCSDASSGLFLPTRLIEISDRGEDPKLRVIHRHEIVVQRPYMTLSHCWGSSNFIKLAKSTYRHLTRSFSISALPKNFCDAVYTAQKLGISYIWIDSLCILQDSKEDWQQEASTMKDVYKNAFCNIAAPGSSGGEGGCFRNRCVKLVQPCIIEKGPFGESGKFVIEHLGLWETDVNSAVLNRRAWVMQERLLSKRILHFGEEQLFWECRELDACETYPEGMPYQFLERANSATKLGLGLTYDDTDVKSLTPSDRLGRTYQIWADIVTEYRRCNLTKSEDKLIAFSGIAKEVQSILGSDHYLAGLWRGNLPSELMWSVGSCEKADGSPSSRPKTYRAPSWSWAAIEGAGSSAVLNYDYSFISILDAEVTPATSDDTGQVASGYLRLQGSLIKVRPYEIHSKTGSVRVTINIRGSRNDFLVAPDVRVDTLDLELYLLPIFGDFTHGRFTLQGLVLQRSAIISPEDQYSRFGTLLGWEVTSWTVPKLPSTVPELVHNFASTLGRDTRSVLERHREDEELKSLLGKNFDRIEERLRDSLRERYCSGNDNSSNADRSRKGENDNVIVLI